MDEVQYESTSNIPVKNKTPKIVAFLCTWCSYAGADLAGTGRNQYPPNLRIIRVPCSGRINPLYIIKALLEGADGVMVSGCHPGDCHYLTGNYHARRRFVVLKKLLTTAGFEPDRIHFTWVSASEGVRFAEVVSQVTQKVEALDQNKSYFKQEENYTGINSVLQLPVAASGFGDNLKYKTLQDDLIPLCNRLLEEGTVDTIIGFKKGEDIGTSLPCFIDASTGSNDLVLNNRCIPTLAGYLSGRKDRVAIIARPCDARAVLNLIKENQLKRGNVFIIGITCFGMVNANNEPLHGCLDCSVRVPPDYDILLGEQQLCTDEPVSEYPLSLYDGFERIINEMNKCILCYSCRQSCYGCYCKTCFIDRGEPDWQTSSPDFGTKLLYHLGRAAHLSGRCVECGACENACASGVDIRYLIHEVTCFIKETYNYRAGMDIDTEPAMLTYAIDDPETGFLGFSDLESADIAGGNTSV